MGCLFPPRCTSNPLRYVLVTNYCHLSEKQQLSATVIAEITNAIAKSINAIAEITNAIAKSINAIAEITNAVAKSINAIAEITNAVAKSINAIAEITNAIASIPILQYSSVKVKTLYQSQFF
ncbi:hypothetical protein [Nostoc sp.]|uniref:hypothetical protein n=1 Tax=Nostoc sp. TaxID=1180 RepID=UPI002FF5D77E